MDYLQKEEEKDKLNNRRRGQFKYCDTDGDDLVTYNEFSRWMMKTAQRRHLYVPTLDDIEALIKEADVIGENVISFDEFCTMMLCEPKKMHEACAKGRWSAVRQRLETHPKEAHFVDTYGQIPLHYAAYNKVPEEILIRLICEFPASVTTKRYLDERTPLDFATHQNAQEVVIELLNLTPEEIEEQRTDLLQYADLVLKNQEEGIREKLHFSFKKNDVESINLVLHEMKEAGLENDPAAKKAKNVINKIYDEEKVRSREKLQEAAKSHFHPNPILIPPPLLHSSFSRAACATGARGKGLHCRREGCSRKRKEREAHEREGPPPFQQAHDQGHVSSFIRRRRRHKKHKRKHPHPRRRKKNLHPTP